ncbi:MAG: zinc ribbon domain-containing protein [Acidobacteriota bacterium]|jgi:putative FmdB family regulatory protein|nr:zinc ribbon domain-containing protein [Acidobacteriota bacterium]MDQ3417702.1 zinc ribbon domain-containing protein [Acidobacteriota bacterium]
MPLYEYQCEKCGRFERIVKFSDPPLAACPTCDGPVAKLFSSPAIQFKGSGFYITDYAKKSSPESSGSKSSSEKSEKSEKSDRADKSSDKSNSADRSSSEKSDKSSSDSSSTAAPAAAATPAKD